MLLDVDGMYREMARQPKIARGKVWCTVCGTSMRVDGAHCLRNGWPKCCGYTMTIDSPEERQSLGKKSESGE